LLFLPNANKILYTLARKLRTIVIDDDSTDIKGILDICNNSPLIEVVKTYSNPREFLENAPALDFDLCLIDIEMPGMDGLTLAQMLGDKPFIFITTADNKLRDALSLAPVDVVIKPIVKERLFRALEKAHELFINKREYELFNVAEAKKKVSLHLPDIILVITDANDPRNKIAFMRNGEKYTLMDCRLQGLLDICPALVQVNISEIVSLEVIAEVEHEIVTIKGITADDAPKFLNLGRTYRKSFKERLFYKR